MNNGNYNNKRLKSIIGCYLLLVLGRLGATSTFTLEGALEVAYNENLTPQISRANFEAEKSLIGKESFLERPSIGFMREGKSSFWSLSQEFAFPTKYITSAEKQRLRSEIIQEGWKSDLWNLRAKIIRGYYEWKSASQMRDLLLAQQSFFKDITKVIISERATGTISQAEELRLYLEQGKLQSEIILQEQLLKEKEIMMKLLLKKELSDEITFNADGETSIPIPILNSKIKNYSFSSITLSPRLRASVLESKLSGLEANLAKQGYLPDFKVSFTKTFPNQEMKDTRIAVEMMIPLWFWSKPGAEVDATKQFEVAQKKREEDVKRELLGEIETLFFKLQNYEHLVMLYRDSLIPKSESLFKGAMSSYRSGRQKNVLETVDAMRNFLQQKMIYYQYVIGYVDQIVQLESLVATSISSFPIPPGV